MSNETFDVCVIGAGCFGAWTAHALRAKGQRVLLVDATGPAHARASSGGESRVIRMGYGRDALYTRWSQASLVEWRALAARTQRPLFHDAGMLWLVGDGGGYVEDTQRTLEACGVAHERWTPVQVARRFPRIATDGIDWALWEPGSGVLMARQAVQALVAEDRLAGLAYRTAAIAPVEARGQSGTMLRGIATLDGATLVADRYVLACGAWLPRVLPDVVGERLFPTRQEIFFFAPPPGDAAFAAMPAWFHHPALVYGIPDLEHRGFKISIDRHGPAIDPDRDDRVPSREGLAEARAYLAKRFPALRDAPLVESRVCQYENTSNGDFILDRHPQFDNVFIAGGGSGHGFKHGPAVGDYVARMVLRGAGEEPRFSLASKAAVQARVVF